MADDSGRKPERRYKIDEKFGYKPDTDPPRTPPTSAERKALDEHPSRSDASSGNERSSEQG